ncbi:MAG: SPOR domain-containing protein [Acetobacteraceae bacterium]|nr:SPOR domain-containing protein [Acetobacteraceae bacterium]
MLLPMQYGGSRYQGLGTTYRMRGGRGGRWDFSARRILLIGGFMTSLVVLGLSIFATLNSYRSGAAPVIEAGRGPLRVRPDNPGGMRVQGQDDDILSTDASARTGTLAPLPEDPALQRLRAQQRAALAAVTPPSVPAPMVASMTAPMPTPVIAPASALPHDRVPVVAPLTAVASENPAPAPQALPVGKRQVQAQLAALGSEQAAKAEWQRLAKRMPEVLGGRQPVVMKAEREGRSIWRLRTGGFSDQTEADAFCAKVKSKGVSCAVAVF